MSFHQSYPNWPLVEAIIIVISCPKATVPAVMSNPESDGDVFTMCFTLSDSYLFKSKFNHLAYEKKQQINN